MGLGPLSTFWALSRRNTSCSKRAQAMTRKSKSQKNKLLVTTSEPELPQKVKAQVTRKVGFAADDFRKVGGLQGKLEHDFREEEKAINSRDG